MKFDDESGVSLERPFCHCGIPAKLRISAKDTSFGRRFFNCPNYKFNKQCGFFQWVDFEMEQNYCCKITLELAQRRNDKINQERVTAEAAKFSAMEKKYNGTLKVLYLSWFCIVVLCAVIVFYVNDNHVSHG
ncbi:uncharacterized protein LOC122302531 [Carya illinoinensis]|uniref:uncharacterized protein LOC122302531 n=1 Tax=Carya illinoinensis TaxID=32201 RepID=UPI001C71F06C|nr:uncharacterized protein LOC122302531 [Carya illinoinensis]